MEKRREKWTARNRTGKRVIASNPVLQAIHTKLNLN